YPFPYKFQHRYESLFLFLLIKCSTMVRPLPTSLNACFCSVLTYLLYFGEKFANKEQMKAQREAISTDENSSFRILLTPNLNELFYWHFHPEFEIVYVEADHGFRHIGDHISKYRGSDLALIGPNIPHLNFDYGVKATVETVVV